MFSRSHVLAFSLHRKNTFFHTDLVLSKRLVVVFQLLSHVWLFATPWTVAHQAPLSMGFPRQECWSGLPCPPPGHLPDPGIKLASSALAGRFSTPEPPGSLVMKPFLMNYLFFFSFIVYVTNKTLLFSSDITEFSTLYYCILYTVYDCKPVSSAGFQVRQ